MNYLAHAYLSFGIPEILAGNMISDFVKGKKKLDYPPAIQEGILLHRAIDAFTDSHAVTRRAKVFFKPAYGLYAGALTDVVYDHFLANDPLQFPGNVLIGTGPGRETDPAPNERLAAFAETSYDQLSAWQPAFPERFARMFPYMRSQNWLYNYRYKEGIFNSFAGLSRRAAYMAGPEAACQVFEEYYTELQSCYRDFFPTLKAFVLASLGQGERESGASGKIE